MVRILSIEFKPSEQVRFGEKTMTVKKIKKICF